jgi:hypothetical protein
MIMHSKLRLPIALLLVSLLLGATIFNISLDARLASEARLITEKSHAQQAARSVREAPSRLAQDNTDAELFKHISKSGFISPENRVGWITALAQTQATMQLGSLSWHMTPQTISTLAPDLYFSGMEFTASPLDPATLNTLIERLRANAPGIFTVERCALTLDPAGGGQANCRMSWWTLANSRKQEWDWHASRGQ